MPVYMTADIDGYRHTGDMSWVSFYIDAKRSYSSPQTSWSDTKLVDFFQHLIF